MTQENKDLLLQDLCARLPYGVKIQVSYEECSGYFDETVYAVDNCGSFHINDRCIEYIKPYLFPLSSMTDEQKKEYYNLCFEEEREEIEFGERIIRVYYHNTIESIDWLNKNHFDYRDLIEKGLAIDCTNLNIY